MPKDTNTKERILDIAEHLIKSQGYNGFSYKEISTELNIKNAAVHYHFPTKKDLGVAVVRRAGAFIKELDQMVATKAIAPVDMLNMTIESYLGYLSLEDSICLGGSLESDFHTLPEEIRKEVKVYANIIISLIRNTLSRGREEGGFTFSGPSEDQAFYITSCLQGALQIARVTGKEKFHRVIDRLKAELGV